MFEGGPNRTRMAVTLYTDSYVVRGALTTFQRRLSDLLNAEERDFLVLEDVVLDEFGTRDVAEKTPYAQINLDTVLFGVGDDAPEPTPELRVIKVPERALVILPPFRIVGRIHLPPETDLKSALGELTGRFLPVTDAAFWSEALQEPRTEAPMIAINHSRAHILAPFVERDVWAGVPRQEPSEGA